jgi:DNA helicase-2/ATP-dependent DNA helicase PcrA
MGLILKAEMTLNEAQLRVVQCDPDAALLVVAGPGSGKTRTIVDRVKHLIDNGVKPAEILCLTFSDKAAEEMRTRIEKETRSAEVETSTFHAFCLRVLEESVFETGVSYKSGLISRTNTLVWGLRNIDSFRFEYIKIGNNAVDVIESIIDGISAFRDELVTPQELRDYVAKKKAELAALQQQLAASGQGPEKGRKKRKKEGAAPDLEDIEEQIAFVNQLGELQKVYESYEQFKRKGSLIDFDDMLQIVVELFRKRQDVLRRYQDRYAHVLVDEFQDNNYAQLELVKLLCPSGNVTVVGDDDQSIYRFRGAYLTIFDDFKQHYGSNARVEKLEQNYRSTKNVVALARQLLDPVPDRETKNLYSDNEEGRVVVATCSTDEAEVDFVVKKIKELLGGELKRRDGTTAPISYRDIAILSRRRLEGIKFARAIRSQGLPCTFVGETRIFAMPVIRDLIAYLKVANDPLANGVELARIMTVHGLSEKDIKIINHEAKHKTRKLGRRTEQDAGKDDHDGNRNFGTDFVHTVMEELATSPESSPIAGDISNPGLVHDIYQQVMRIIDARNKKSLYEFVYDVVMAQTDIYRRTLKNASPESERNRLALDEFLRMVQDFEAMTKKASLKDLLDHLDMMNEFEIEIRQNENIDAIVVTTIHQSKGREFPIVFVVDVAERRLPVRFMEKKFYCPSELAQSVRAKGKSERELFLQEERRLLYVAMTRAQHHLFLTLAEIYGDNTTKTKPSQFLVELDIENNPYVEFAHYDAAAELPLVAANDSRADQLKQECQALVTKFIEQMQLNSALEKMVELAIIAHYQSGRPLAEFRISDVFSIEQPLAEEKKKAVEMQLQDNRVPLVDPDKIHFSASALNTYQDCPLKYKFSYVLEVPTKARTYFDLGSAVHSVLEMLTRRQIEEKGYLPTVQDALALLDKYWVSSTYQSNTQEQEDRESAKKMLEYFVRWCAERKTLGCGPVSAETQFEIEVAGKKLKGFIDRIDMSPSGDYEVFDYKTSKSMLSGNTIKKDIQMNAYSLAVQAIYGRLPATANLLYVRNEKPVVYPVTNDTVQQSEQEVGSLTNGILSERFEPTPSYQTCKFCDYWSICEAKEIEDDET